MDIFGNPKDSNSEKFECLNCKVQYPASRFAPHLEKCLGLGRRAKRFFLENYNRANTLDRYSSPFPDFPDEDEEDAKSSIFQWNSWIESKRKQASSSTKKKSKSLMLFMNRNKTLGLERRCIVTWNDVWWRCFSCMDTRRSRCFHGTKHTLRIQSIVHWYIFLKNSCARNGSRQGTHVW